MVDNLRKLSSTKEVFDRRRDALLVDQSPRGHVLDILDTHALLDGAAEFQETFAEFLTSQFVDGSQPTISQVVDVVETGRTVLVKKVDQVLDRSDEVFGSQCHFVFRNGQTELAVDSESTHSTESVAVDIEEFLMEQLLGFLQSGRITRSEPLIDSEQGFFVARGVVLCHRIEQIRDLGCIHDLDGLDSAGADHIADRLGDLVTGFDDDFTSPLVIRRENNIIASDLVFDFGQRTPIADFLGFHLVENREHVGVGTELRRHSSQQRDHRELARLVDPDLQGIFFRYIDFNPTSAFGNHASGWEFSIRCSFGLLYEIDPWRAVELAYDDPFGTVDDEFTTPEHDRNIAQKHLFFERLLSVQSQPNLKRLAVGQPQLTALFWSVTGLAQFEPQVLERSGRVVTCDRENFPQNPFEPLILSLVRSDILLEKGFVGGRLEHRQVRDWELTATRSENPCL